MCNYVNYDVINDVIDDDGVIGGDNDVIGVDDVTSDDVFNYVFNDDVIGYEDDAIADDDVIGDDSSLLADSRNDRDESKQ